MHNFYVIFVGITLYNKQHNQYTYAPIKLFSFIKPQRCIKVLKTLNHKHQLKTNYQRQPTKPKHRQPT